MLTIYRKGPENFYFTSEHAVSKSLSNSRIVTDALSMYKDTKDESDNAKNLRAGEWVFINIGEQYLPEFIAKGLYQYGTGLTPEHFIGSALVKITISEDKKNYIIQIWNSTSLGSGTGIMQSVSRPSSSNNQPYTNVSQSFEIVIPIE